jgi:adenine phosphoribosyltransferase
MSVSVQSINDSISIIKDFPKKGINFRDICHLLADNDIREKAFDLLYELVKDIKIDYVAGIDPRGFIFGVPLAQRLKCGFVMLKKSLKTPNTILVPYGQECVNVLTIQTGLIPHEANVLIVDDILATGGSLVAACELIERIGCNVVGCLCLIELIDCPKKDKLLNNKIFSLLQHSDQ